MLHLILPAALLASFAFTAPVKAQVPVPANQRYCLEVGDASGTHPLLCRFESLQQCNASKTALGDQCMINPYLVSQQPPDRRR